MAAAHARRHTQFWNPAAKSAVASKIPRPLAAVTSGAERARSIRLVAELSAPQTLLAACPNLNLLCHSTRCHSILYGMIGISLSRSPDNVQGPNPRCFVTSFATRVAAAARLLTQGGIALCCRNRIARRRVRPYHLPPRRSLGPGTPELTDILEQSRRRGAIFLRHTRRSEEPRPALEDVVEDTP